MHGDFLFQCLRIIKPYIMIASVFRVIDFNVLCVRNVIMFANTAHMWYYVCEQHEMEYARYVGDGVARR